ncbi:hypothetical protein F5Y11DRAFT_328927 [Daldinia sp. FL1419]|nr:hypothetical protein F5Y11DRAFT_328927 [Daldinia sp. FL1419]
MGSLRRLPFSFGIGTDICHIDRIAKIISQDKGARFIQRVLTPEEIESAKNAALHPRNSPSSVARFLAGRHVRWAAKEAVIKACSIYKVTFHDITITYEHVLAKNLREEIPRKHDPQYPQWQIPRATSSPVAIIRGHDTRGTYARLSITHDGDYAVATCVMFWGEFGSEEKPPSKARKESKTDGGIWSRIRSIFSW